MSADRIDDTIRSMIRPKTNGPLKVLAAGDETVTIDEGGLPNTITGDRVTPMPTRRGK